MLAETTVAAFVAQVRIDMAPTDIGGPNYGLFLPRHGDVGAQWLVAEGTLGAYSDIIGHVRDRTTRPTRLTAWRPTAASRL